MPLNHQVLVELEDKAAVELVPTEPLAHPQVILAERQELLTLAEVEAVRLMIFHLDKLVEQVDLELLF